MLHVRPSSSLRSLMIALALNAAYTLVEVVAALLAGSLSLLADAGHNLSDVVALSVAAGAVLLARRPSTPNRSFGFRRAEILAALVNAVVPDRDRDHRLRRRGTPVCRPARCARRLADRRRDRRPARER